MWYKVAKKTDIPVDSTKQVHVQGKPIMLANLEGEFFAIGDTCTHEQCSLSTGYLDGNAIICACHGAQFDITTGEVLSPPAPAPEPVYKVKIEADDIYIEV